jgi:uncharacterized protein
MAEVVEGRIAVSPEIGEVSTLLLAPERAACLLVLAHGAGTDMRHRSMEATAQALVKAGVATLRYNFPYKERGDWRTDPPRVAAAAVRAAVLAGREALPDLPLLAGGRSFGGRMTSTAAAEAPLPGVRGIVFYGFPLHPAGRPSVERAEHLDRVAVPMLFLQGSSDALAELHLLQPVVERLGGRAALHVFKGADHSFKTPKRLGVTEGQLLYEAAQLVRAFGEC